MEVKIDFDDSSKCWGVNKKHIGKSYFVYTCNYIYSNGKQCRCTIYNCLLTNKYKDQFNYVDFYDRYKYYPNRAFL